MQMATCNYFWGSHGCSLPKDHAGTVHLCGDKNDPCSEYEADDGCSEDRRLRMWNDGTKQWGEWLPYGEGFWG